MLWHCWPELSGAWVQRRALATTRLLLPRLVVQPLLQLLLPLPILLLGLLQLVCQAWRRLPLPWRQLRAQGALREMLALLPDIVLCSLHRCTQACMVP